MRKLLGTTRGRLVLLSVVALTASMLIADAGIYTWLTFSQRSEIDGLLQGQAGAIGSGLERVSGQVTFRGQPLPGETDGGVAVDAAVVGPSGVLTESQQEALTPDTLREIAAPVLRTHRPIWVDLMDSHHVNRRVFVAPVSPGPRAPAALVVSRSVGELQDSLWRTMATLVLLSLTIVVLGGFLAHWLAGRILRPVHEIAALAGTLSQRELHRRVDFAVPDDELGELVGTFNGMLGRLEASFQALRSFTADASHELRAPLTLMSSEVEVALSRPRPPDEYRRVLELIAGEVRHLTGIVEGLLFLARADAGQARPELQPIDVVDLVHEAVARWSQTAERKRVTLEGVAPAAGQVPADPGLMRRILDNLIDNAIEHAPESSTVRVEAGSDAAGWLFSVTDQGPGVPVDLRQRVFSRFTRGDPARSSEGGSGLGLALSRTAARAQGGDLVLLNSAAGARFELAMPKGDRGLSKPRVRASVRLAAGMWASRQARRAASR